MKWRGSDARCGRWRGGTIATQKPCCDAAPGSRCARNAEQTKHCGRQPHRIREIPIDAGARIYPISCHATTVDRLWFAALIHSPATSTNAVRPPRHPNGTPVPHEPASLNRERAATHRVPRWRARTESRPGGTAATCAAPSRDAPRSGSQASRSRNRNRRPIRRMQARASHA